VSKPIIVFLIFVNRPFIASQLNVGIQNQRTNLSLTSDLTFWPVCKWKSTGHCKARQFLRKKSQLFLLLYLQESQTTNYTTTFS